jgi:hypothetical protein
MTTPPRDCEEWGIPEGAEDEAAEIRKGLVRAGTSVPTDGSFRRLSTPATKYARLRTSSKKFER